MSESVSTKAAAASRSGHVWRFFRAGGFDQVRLDSAADLLNLKHLDQTLWVALSCPTRGIEFDARTLQLVDTDQDGHIRAPELLAAIDWAAAQLCDTSVLAGCQDGLPLAAIGAEPLRAAAQRLLGDEGETVLTVTRANTAAAEAAAQCLLAWEASRPETLLSGAATEAAAAALAAVKEKIDDYFVRCQLAAFDPRAGVAMNASDTSLQALGATLLCETHADLAALPLATVGAGGTASAPALSFDTGINPAWSERIASFREQVVTPLLGPHDSLSAADWLAVQQGLAPFLAWQAARPGYLPPDAEANPGDAIRDLERLTRYVRDLLPLANSFVAFRDFYMRQGPGNFQIGTLYLDGRAAELCVAVNDAAKHAALAGLSRICLVYCECVRPGATQTIAAAFTAGDSDQLMPGRNGVFYDRQGRDWDATIIRIVDHPISLRQAFWSPYKKLGRLVGEQLQKLAASKAAGVEGRLAETAAGAGKHIENPAAPTVPVTKPALQQAFDVGKFAGIFAAIGLAVGAIGTALAAMVTGLLGLRWWQIPLALGGLMLLVSGPALALAWFKLRSRTLGPLLDANGWAVNARARINIPFGRLLTRSAQLPDDAERTLTDPYAEENPPWKLYAIVSTGVLLLIIVFAAKLRH